MNEEKLDLELLKKLYKAMPDRWWIENQELVWQLFRDGGNPQGHGFQVLKAPKNGTPYAEYWPDEDEASFIIAALNNLPLLLDEIDRLNSRLNQSMPSPLLAGLEKEITRQNIKSPQDHTTMDWFAILGESFGKVDREITKLLPPQDGKRDLQNYRTELIQLAAVALRMVKSHDQARSRLEDKSWMR